MVSRASLIAAVALLAHAGCGGAERASPTDGSSAASAQPTRLFLAGDGELTVVDVDAGTAEVRRMPELAPGDPLHRIVRRGNTLILYGRDEVGDFYGMAAS